MSDAMCRSGDSHHTGCPCHEARWQQRLAASEERAGALMKALLWCDLVLGQAMTADDDAEQPVPGEETASSIKWRLRRVLHRLRECKADRDSEGRWAKEYLDRATASEERARRLEHGLYQIESHVAGFAVGSWESMLYGLARAALAQKGSEDV